MNNKDLIIRDKLKKDKQISDKAEKIFDNFKEEFKLENNKGKKEIKISLNKFIGIAASIAIVGALGTILCLNRPWENKSKLDIQAEQKDEPKVPEIVLDKEWRKDNIELKYPSDWELTENETYATPTVLAAPGNNDDEKAKLYITINENTGNRTAKEIIEVATNPDYGVPTETVDEGEKDIAGAKAYYKTQSMLYDDGSNWRSTTIILIKDIFMYEFRFTGIEEEYNSYYPVFEKMLDTVEISEPTYIGEDKTSNNDANIELTNEENDNYIEPTEEIGFVSGADAMLEMLRYKGDYKANYYYRLVGLKNNNNGTYTANVEFHSPIFESQEKYNSLVRNGWGEIEGEIYNFSNEDNENNIGYGYIYNDNNIYTIEKREIGYGFYHETGGVIKTIETPNGSFEKTLNEDVIVREFPSGGKYKLKEYAKTLTDSFISRNMITFEYSEESGDMYLLRDVR